MTGQHTISSEAQPEGKAEPPGTPIFVEVTAKTGANGIEFSHVWRWNENGPSQGSGTIKVPARKDNQPGTPMHFRLNDETDPKRHLKFAERDGAAMWVLRDSCPPESTICKDPEFPLDKMKVTSSELKAFDTNSDECTLHYRLWFTDKDGKYETYDPDITNGGKTMF